MRLFLLSALLATTTAAQPALGPLPANDGPTLSVEVLYGLMEPFPITTATSGPDPTPLVGEISTTASAVVLGGRVPVGGVTLVGEVPVGYYGIDYPQNEAFSVPSDQGALGLGNPYVGAEARPYRGVVVSGGLRLPLVQYNERPRSGGGRDEPGDESAELEGWQGGLFAESEHFEAWLPEVFGASVGVGVATALAAGVRAEARTDGTVLVPTSGDGDQAADLVLGGGLGLAADAGLTELRAGVYSRQILTEGRYGQSSVFNVNALLTAGIALDLGTFRPALEARVPLSSTPYDRDATLAVRLDIAL